VAGGLFGLAEGGLLVILVLFGLSHSPLPQALRPVFEQAQLAPPLVRFGETLLRQGREAFSGRSLPSGSGKPQSREV